MPSSIVLPMPDLQGHWQGSAAVIRIVATSIVITAVPLTCVVIVNWPFSCEGKICLVWNFNGVKLSSG